MTDSNLTAALPAPVAEYVRACNAFDTDALSGGEPRLSEAAKSELSTALQAFLPDAPLTWMIELGADAVAAGG